MPHDVSVSDAIFTACRVLNTPIDRTDSAIPTRHLRMVDGQWR